MIINDGFRLHELKGHGCLFCFVLVLVLGYILRHSGVVPGSAPRNYSWQCWGADRKVKPYEMVMFCVGPKAISFSVKEAEVLFIPELAQLLKLS